MNVVVFGLRYHPYTRDVLKSLQERNIKPSTLIEFRPHYKASQITTSSDIDEEFLSKISFDDIFSSWAIKTGLMHPIVSMKLLLKIVRKQPDKKNPENFLKGITVYSIDSHNDDICKEILTSISPDVIVLAPASAIIRKNILSIPKIGTINAHMGKLPEFRGMNALEWTIFKTRKAYISVHFVDEGLDTGDILRVKQIPMNEQNLSEMRIIARKEMANLIAEVLADLPKGNITVRHQQNTEGKQYFVMHKKLFEYSNEILKKNDQKFIN